MKLITNIRGEVFTEGNRVMTYDFSYKAYYGVLYENTENKEVSEWYVKYDDGKELAVLDFDFLWKINPRNFQELRSIVDNLKRELVEKDKEIDRLSELLQEGHRLIKSWVTKLEQPK